MPEIKDRNGDVWHPVMDIGTLRLIEQRTGVTLLNTPGPQAGARPAELLEDPEKLVVTIGCMCKAECDERGISVSDLAQRLRRGPFIPMVNAFNEEFAAFMGMDLDALRAKVEEGGEIGRPPQAGRESGGSAPEPESAPPGASGSGS